MSDHLLTIDVFERRLAEEFGAQRVALVREVHETRFSTVKWAFVFWFTQFVATAGMIVGLFSMMLHGPIR